MVGIYGKFLGAACGAGLLLALSPLTSSATVTGGCSVEGSASISGTKDLTSADIWHLKTADEVTGTATYPTQTYVHIYAFLFGIPVPVYVSSGKDTHGSAGPYHVSTYSQYTRVFAAGGQSDTCTGSVLIIVDDQSPFTNLGGLVGAVLLVIGLVGLLVLMFARTGAGGCGATFFGILAGFIFGLGGALILAEAGLVDPRTIVGLVFVGVGVLLGILVPQVRARLA